MVCGMGISSPFSGVLSTDVSAGSRWAGQAGGDEDVEYT